MTKGILNKRERRLVAEAATHSDNIGEVIKAPDPCAHLTADTECRIEIAWRQQVKSLELRAVMSLSWLWQSQGKKEEARQLLAEIYGWFTEGFDTADLQEARALLAALA